MGKEDEIDWVKARRRTWGTFLIPKFIDSAASNGGECEGFQSMETVNEPDGCGVVRKGVLVSIEGDK